MREIGSEEGFIRPIYKEYQERQIKQAMKNILEYLNSLEIGPTQDHEVLETNLETIRNIADAVYEKYKEYEADHKKIVARKVKATEAEKADFMNKWYNSPEDVSEFIF
ncbi:MAG: hypothetical protein QW478_09995 [Candidatus Micrarchaeaceae archaeon]